MASPLANAVAFISHNLNKQILCCCGSYSNTPQKKIKNYFSANSILKNSLYPCLITSQQLVIPAVQTLKECYQFVLGQSGCV